MSHDLHRRALLLSWFTVGYNIVEGIVSIAAGAAAGSIALIGFGMDSFIESLSGSVMIWRFSGRGSRTDDEERQIEEIAQKLVGATFFIFATYVFYESAAKLLRREMPDPSLVGIVIASLSIVIMPVLYVLKYRTGKAIGSRGLVADSKETLACVYLSVSLLAGLGLNYFFRLWWADPVVGLLVVYFLVREGIETFGGEEGDEDDD
ncbi:MAG: DUF2391 family protein [Candidatus Latescibacteria bacterium]|nr:DUF2391 family protein [Candidatus Latescibacterota bacterium]